MSDSKTILVGNPDTSLTAMLPALLQNKGIDPSAAMAMINSNNNRGGLLGNNGIGDIIALVIIAAIFGYGNGGGGLFGGGNNNQASTAEREMLMQALQRNGVDISQLAQSVNVSSSQILAAINQVAGSICNLGNQMGQNTNQIITAILQGNNALATQLANCCCDMKQIVTKGFADLGFATERQTCSIEKAIAASTEAILAGQRNAEMREMQREITERDRRIAEQATAINNYQQTQTFAAMLGNAINPLAAGLQHLQGDVDGIKCKLPKTETIIATPDYVPINRSINVGYAAVPACGYNFGFPYGNGNGSFF